MPRSRRTTPDRPALIVIAEDHADTREIYASVLLHEGFRVETVADGAAAVCVALDEHPDLIVMDLSLPHLDGWEATRRLKRDPRTAHIPVIACTAHIFGGSLERALDAGCDAYVTKPCLPQDLVREVRAVLRRFGRRSA